MIWALLFIVLFSGSDGSGESVYYIPKIDKYVKKYVVDEGRKNPLLVLIKDSKKERKNIDKEYKKQKKELWAITRNRATTSSDFKAFTEKAMQLHKKAQYLNVELNSKANNLISEDEWREIMPHVKTDLLKLADKNRKLATKFKKVFEKLGKQISRTIKDDKKSQNCLNALSQFQSLLKTKFEDRMALFTDENSILFQYYVSETEAIEMHVSARLDLEQLLLAHAHLHAVIVENTTEGEWKIIRRKL